MRWTPAQQEAINARGSNLLVSAAAGSGKTAVLAERIVSLVKEGTRIDEMLVVTFTKAAAGEMRARILTTLHDAAGSGDAHLAAQALSVERADIVTLHGFCSQICRNHFQAAGVDPTFRVADGAEAAVLRETAMTEALTACYERMSSVFSYAAEALSQAALMESVSMLHRFLMARPDPWEWLAEAIAAHAVTAQSLEDSPWMAVMLGRVQMDAAVAVEAYDRFVAFAEANNIHVDFAQAEATMAREFLHALDGGYRQAMAALPLAFETRPRRQKHMDDDAFQTYAKLRDEAKAILKKAGETLQAFTNLEERAEDEADVGLLLAGIAEVTQTFGLHYSDLKQQKNLLDFNDLEHFALRAVQDEGVANALRMKYRHVFVDEYQDSSLLQEAILQHIRRADNLFMVGDIKQSIYRFRLAEPSLFLSKLRTFGRDATSRDRRVALNANFRSHFMLLNGINTVFSTVFTGGAMEIDYPPEDRLLAGTEPDWEGAPIELHLLKSGMDDGTDDDEAPTAAELSPQARESIRQEVEIIADRIIALQSAPEKAYAWKDMVILMRTVRGKAAQVVEVLRSRGIAAWSDLGEDALDRCEVQAIVSLLQVIDNFHQDVPLLAALRGPAFGIADDDLATIRSAQPEGTIAEAVLAYAAQSNELALALRRFVEQIRGWAMDAQVLALDCLVRQLYNDTGHYAQSGARPDGDIRQGNLRVLAEHAGVYQRTQGGGLGGFLRYLSKVKAHEGLAAQELGEGDSVVRVMSIHKSKGLQFPVVFVAGLGRRFGKTDAKLPMALHNTLGAGMHHIDPALRTKRTTLSQQAILEKSYQESIAEEARVLYVAMTRAESRLILVGTPKENQLNAWAEGTFSHNPFAGSMLDWIAASVFGNEAWQVQIHGYRNTVSTLASIASVQSIAAQVRAFPQPSAERSVARALNWQAPLVTYQPLKQSVSSVVRTAAKDGERDEMPRRLSSVPSRPLFLEEKGLNAAERGDAVHIFLRNVDIHAQDLDAECRRMQEKGILSAEQASALRLRKISQMMESDVWKRLQQASEVHREWPFNLSVRKNGYRTLLQGIIDCCFEENGGWIVLDYKTDRADKVDAVLQNYTAQVTLYADALAAMTGRPIKERIIYFIDQNAHYSV